MRISGEKNITFKTFVTLSDSEGSDVSKADLDMPDASLSFSMTNRIFVIFRTYRLGRFNISINLF